MTAGRRDQLATADPYCHWHHPDPCESWGCDLAAALRLTTDQPGSTQDSTADRPESPATGPGGP